MPLRILAGDAVIPEFDSGAVIDFIGVIFLKNTLDAPANYASLRARSLWIIGMVIKI